MTYIDITLKMLHLQGPQKYKERCCLPVTLSQRLARIDRLIRACPYPGEATHNLGLRSRQVIAMVVEQWLREQPVYRADTGERVR
jgi:hypothetical protein